MVGEENFLATQGPEDLQNRSQPGQRPSLGIGLITAPQPMSHAGECLAGERKAAGWERSRPPDQRRRVEGSGKPIRVLQRRHRLFPRAVLHPAPPQCLAASQQAVVRVRERKQRKEGEGLSATVAKATSDPNPVMMFIVRLLAAAPVADDRIAFANGASPQDDLIAVSGPIGFELVRRGGKWDKENRGSQGLCPGVDPPRSEPEAEPLLLKRNPNWKRITLLSFSS